MLTESAKKYFRRKTGLVASFLAGYNITEQSWLFLFNVGMGLHLRLAGTTNRGRHWLEHHNFNFPSLIGELQLKQHNWILKLPVTT